MKKLIYRISAAIVVAGIIIMKRRTQTSLDKGTQRKTTENELPSLTQCTA